MPRKRVIGVDISGCGAKVGLTTRDMGLLLLLLLLLLGGVQTGGANTLRDDMITKVILEEARIKVSYRLYI